MKKALKGLYLTLIVLFLYLPIGTLMVLSFNSGKTMNAWTGFSLDWYEAVSYTHLDVYKRQMHMFLYLR